MIQNWGLPPKFNNYQTKLPTSLNAGFSVPVKDWKQELMVIKVELEVHFSVQ